MRKGKGLWFHFLGKETMSPSRLARQIWKGAKDFTPIPSSQDSVCMCECLCVCTYVHKEVWDYLWRVFLNHSLHLFFFWQDLLLAPGLVNNLWDSSLHLQGWGYKQALLHLTFSLGSGDGTQSSSLQSRQATPCPTSPACLEYFILNLGWVVGAGPCMCFHSKSPRFEIPLWITFLSLSSCKVTENF